MYANVADRTEGVNSTRDRKNAHPLTSGLAQRRREVVTLKGSVEKPPLRQAAIPLAAMRRKRRRESAVSKKIQFDNKE